MLGRRSKSRRYAGRCLDYVVTCPRAACPFDYEEQDSDYPSNYCREILELASRLLLVKSPTNECVGVHNGHVCVYTTRVGNVRVGVHCGPLAGITLAYAGVCWRVLAYADFF
jgi:hypothetical protein